MTSLNNDGIMRRGSYNQGLSNSKIESARRFLYDEDESFGSVNFNKSVRRNTNLSGFPTVTSVPYGNENTRGRDYSSKRCLCAIVLIGILAVCVWTSFVVASGRESPEHVDEKRIQEFQSKIVELGLSLEGDIETTGTPQYHALQWLANDDGAKLDVADAHAMQRYALAVLFYSTAGTEDHIDPNANGQWVNQTNWMTGAGFCSWHGVKCIADSTEHRNNEDGDVLALDLSQNGLDGVLPSELSAFSLLQRLDFSHNGLTGNLPKNFETLTGLRSLILRNNKLSGTIPKGFGIKLTNMVWLNLGENQLHGPIPSEMEHMVDLRSLGLDRNQLSGKIPDLEDLSKLKKLYLKENNLEGPFPGSLSKLTSLVEINLSGNHLTGLLPSEIEKLTKLELLILNKMNLRGTIPGEIFKKVTRLTELNLSNNHFGGQIPTSIGHLKDIQGFFLGENKLTGTIPRQVGLMVDLKRFEIDGNNIGGTIPNLISALNSLEGFKLSRNSITGTIPPDIGNLHRLVELEFESNKLEGKVPPEIGNLVNLKQARLYDNNLTGDVPKEVCALTKDEDLAYLGVDCASDKVNCDCCTKCF